MAKPPQPDDIDFVVDIDNVLTFNDCRDLPQDQVEELIRLGIVVEANKKLYRIAHGAGVFLQSLTHIHGSRVSFYSAHAKPRRTAELLGKISLPNGKLAWDIAHNILFRPSTIRLDFLDPSLKSKFRSPWEIFNPLPGNPQEKKDLARVTYIPNLDRMYLIDDAIANAMPGQEKSLLWSMPRNGPIELMRIRGLIARALRLAKKHELTPVEALFQLQWTAESRVSGNQLEYDYVSTMNGVLERGREKFLAEAPNFTTDDPYFDIVGGRGTIPMLAHNSETTPPSPNKPRFPWIQRCVQLLGRLAHRLLPPGERGEDD